MSKEKFTQGEWEVRGNTIFLKDTNRSIASIHVQKNYKDITFEQIEDVEANANAVLVKSAPKMYSALESSLQMLEQTLAYRNANGIRFGNVFLECTIDQVKEALDAAN